MKLQGVSRTEARAPRLRRRFGYDHEWWGRDRRGTAEADGYWWASRRSLTSLIFVLPLLLVYEAAILRGGGDAGGLRGAADGWIGAGCRAVGLVDPWWPPSVLVLALLGCHARERQPWRCRGPYFAAMTGECGLLAAILVGLGKLIELGFPYLEALPTTAAPAVAPANPLAPVVEYLGVGLYEELLFRLALIPVIYGVLRLLRAPRVVARTLALTGSALAFSLAHHLGTPGESFSWFPFVFRWSAGVYFGWIFSERGYGVAVGTHAAYDILVGCLGLRL